MKTRFVLALAAVLALGTAAVRPALLPSAPTARQTSDAEWKQRLVGKWKYTGTVPYTVEYKSDGTFKTPTASGYWDVKEGKLITGRETQLLIKSRKTEQADIVSLQGNVLVLRRNGDVTSYERTTD